MGERTLENLLGLRHVAINPCVRRPGDLDLARMTLTEELAKLTTQHGLTAEIAEALEDLSDISDEALTWRLSQAAQARNQAERSGHEDKAEYDTGDNGARINRDERERFEALLQQIGQPKSKQ